MTGSEMIIQIVNITEMFFTNMAVHSYCVFMKSCNMSLNTVGVKHFVAEFAQDFHNIWKKKQRVPGFI